MKISNLIKNVRQILDSNSPVILTGIAVSGACLTAYLAARGGYKARDAIVVKEIDVSRRLEPMEKFVTTYKFYAPAAISLAGSVTCMVLATKIGLDRTAAVAGAFIVAERANEEYRGKVKELLGDSKHTKVVDSVNSEIAHKTDIPDTIVLKEAEQVFIDAWSGRTFPCTMEKINQAINRMNHELIYGQYVSLTEFYRAVGLPQTQESDEIGWDSERLIEMVFTPTLKDDKAVITCSFENKPMPGFQGTHKAY